jgi:hypothetical protein
MSLANLKKFNHFSVFLNAGLPIPQFAELFFGEAEVVADFVEDGFADLGYHSSFGFADPLDIELVNNDPLGISIGGLDVALVHGRAAV